MTYIHHFLTLLDNFWFNVIRHRQSVAAFIFRIRLTESDVSVTPSVMCMDWLHWWYNDVVHL